MSRMFSKPKPPPGPSAQEQRIMKQQEEIQKKELDALREEEKRLAAEQKALEEKKIKDEEDIRAGKRGRRALLSSGFAGFSTATDDIAKGTGLGG